MKLSLMLTVAVPFLTITTLHPSLVSSDWHLSDTTATNHVSDGSVSEWPRDKFVSDSVSSIQYAIDNDNHNFYLALKVTDRTEQLKIMRMGMKLFIDLKGKKKESRGIEFPVKGETNGYQPDNFKEAQNEQHPGENRNAENIKIMFKLNVVSLKLFGFENHPEEQGLVREGSAKIAFNWDSTNTLAIEYLIPLSLFKEDLSSLNEKTISIGWKINGVDRSSFSGDGQQSYSGGYGRGEGESRGSRYGSGGGFHGGHQGDHSGNGQRFDPDKFSKEQNIWSKYTLAFKTS